MTKIQKLKEWLLRYGSITSWEAIQGFRETRLAARIKELKAKGWEIETKMFYDRDPDGTPIQYARYYLRSIKEAKK